MRRGICGDPDEQRPFRRGCGLGPRLLNQWGICEDCVTDNGADLETRDAERFDLERRYAEPPEYQWADLERWQDAMADEGRR